MSMRKTLAIAGAVASASLALASVTQAAGTHTSTHASTSTGTQATHTQSVDDFVTKASVANEFEIESSKLALEKSQNKKVRDFAQHMIDDHSKAGEELKSTVSDASLDTATVKETLDDKH